MPFAAKRPCTYPGCPALTDRGRCDVHRRVVQRVDDARRGSARQRGYDSRWERARAEHLRQHPLCVDCADEGYIVPATVVDHVIPHKGDRVLFWDRANWASRCAPHHNRKTASQDGGFGNARQPPNL